MYYEFQGHYPSGYWAEVFDEFSDEELHSLVTTIRRFRNKDVAGQCIAGFLYERNRIQYPNWWRRLVRRIKQEWI
jgi:hypothetical protein